MTELEKLARETRSDATRVAAYEHLGALYADLKQLSDAERVYRAGFDLEGISTAIRENFRGALAGVLSRQLRDRDVLALFEHPDRPVCAHPPENGQLALAYAYAEAGQLQKAQAVVDAQRARGRDEFTTGDDVTRWDKLQMILACRGDQRAACLREWDRMVRWPFRDEPLTGQLTTELRRLRQWPEATEWVARATQDGHVVGDRVAPLNYPRQEPRPLHRRQPQYPRDAARSGVEGTVLLQLFIGEDGKVITARVLKATPARFFEGASLAAVRHWTFQPAIFNGKPMKFTGLQRIDFMMAE